MGWGRQAGNRKVILIRPGRNNRYKQTRRRSASKDSAKLKHGNRVALPLPPLEFARAKAAREMSLAKGEQQCAAVGQKSIQRDTKGGRGLRYTLTCFRHTAIGPSLSVLNKPQTKKISHLNIYHKRKRSNLRNTPTLRRRVRGRGGVRLLSVFLRRAGGSDGSNNSRKSAAAGLRRRYSSSSRGQ